MVDHALSLEPDSPVIAYVAHGALLFARRFDRAEQGLLRALEGNRGWLFHGNWSWVPYAIDVVGLVVIAALVWMARSKRAKKTKRSPKS